MIWPLVSIVTRCRASARWSAENRKFHEREGLHYPSDLTDAEWRLVERLVPPAKHGGRPRSICIRTVVNAILYLLSTGCQWSALPKEFPPKTTVHDYLELWSWDGTLMAVLRALYTEPREPEGRRTNPTAIVFGSVPGIKESTKRTEGGGLALIYRVMNRARRFRAAKYLSSMRRGRLER